MINQDGWINKLFNSSLINTKCAIFHENPRNTKGTCFVNIKYDQFAICKYL